MSLRAIEVGFPIAERFVRTERPDWAAAVGRVLDVMEGAPLLDRMK